MIWAFPVCGVGLHRCRIHSTGDSHLSAPCAFWGREQLSCPEVQLKENWLGRVRGKWDRLTKSMQVGGWWPEALGPAAPDSKSVAAFSPPLLERQCRSVSCFCFFFFGITDFFFFFFFRQILSAHIDPHVERPNSIKFFLAIERWAFSATIRAD